jgi:uncharacterized membrane protein YphA (DoxX/SURF4 family)
MQSAQSFKKYFGDIISFIFIFLFVYAAASKLLDYQKFRLQLGQSPILTHFAGWIAWVIPGLEIIISVLLVFPAYRILGLYASFSLMTLFTAYIIAITRFSEYIPCSCGGVLQRMNWDQHLIFNLLFVMLSLVCILFDRPWSTIKSTVINK